MNQKIKDYSYLFWGIVVTASLLCAGIVVRMVSIDIFELLKAYIIIFLLFGALKVIAITGRMPFFSDKRIVRDIGLGYILSSVLICASVKIPLYFLWMLGSVYIAKKVNSYLGIFFQLIFTFLLCTLNSYGVEEFIYYFIIGALLCVLIHHADSLITSFYVLVIVGSIQIILSFLMNNFEFDEVISGHALYLLLSTAILVLLGRLLKPQEQAGETAVTLAGAQEMNIGERDKPSVEANVLQEADDTQFENTEPVYARLMSSDAPLMRQLNEEKPNTYRHSLLIGILSAKAAKKVGADENLAKAGGFYHEIGKLKGGDYIEAGTLLAAQQELPAPLINIIRQQNGKLEKPDSKEAAIVMLTDSIITAIKYFEKQPPKLQRSHDKIIDDIFKVRMEQGSLERAPLTLHEFHILKEFYRTNLPK